MTTIQNSCLPGRAGGARHFTIHKMKSTRAIPSNVRSLIIAALLYFVAGTGFAETNVVRLAVGPFFAPAGNPKLAEAAAPLPDLLTAALSPDNRFQLVEREKVNALWSEFHLTEAGLTSADTVARLGKVLSCDWLVSGSLVPAESGPQVWIKVIDTASGVVLDLQALPYNPTNFPATAADIARFLAQARTRTQPREFIALEKFRDFSASATREDWTPRLVALIEKHFLAAGYGVVERETVAPIFSEYQLQSAGMTGDAAKRVKLKPAFWIVAGSWKWFRDTEDKLSVTVRIQKMGGGEQMLSFAKPPGPELEKAIVDGIQSALQSAGSPTATQAQAAEEKLHAKHIDELVKGRGETWAPSRFDTNPSGPSITVTDRLGGKRQLTIDPNMLAQRESQKQEMLKTLQQAILLNPKDMHAKFKLGQGLFDGSSTVESKHGQDLLEEVAKSGDPVYAVKARNWLDDIRTGKISIKGDPFGNREIVTHGQPASLPPMTNRAAAKDALAARVAKMHEITNIASRAESVATFPSSLLCRAHIENISTAKYLQGKVYIAAGTTLFNYDFKSGYAVQLSLPVPLQHTITALEAGDGMFWLGTADGLIRISLADHKTRVFGEKDGFPSSSISALRLVPGRLFIGFGSQRNGALGWLDLATEKFTGLMAPAGVGKSWADAVKSPPDSPVSSIATLDGNNFWVASEVGLQHLDLGANQWSLATPTDLAGVRGLGDNALAVNAKYLVAETPQRCVAVCPQPGAQWTCINVSTNFGENLSQALALDPVNPDWLWIGGGEKGMLTLLDLSTSTIIAQGHTTSHGEVEWILATTNQVVFIARSSLSGFHDLYCLDKATLFESKSAAAPPGK
jgi:hypothetical protein